MALAGVSITLNYYLNNKIALDAAGQAYTFYTIDYGTNGKAASTAYNNRMTATWTTSADGTSQIDCAGVTGAADFEMPQALLGEGVHQQRDHPWRITQGARTEDHLRVVDAPSGC
jgi:hypothetical protein